MRKSALHRDITRALYGRAGERQHVETDLVKATLDYLGALRIRAFRRNVGALDTIDADGRRRTVRFNQRGMADVWGVGPLGIHIEIELKASGKTPTPEQAAWLALVRERGGIAFWADSIESVISQLHAEFLKRGVAL